MTAISKKNIETMLVVGPLYDRIDVLDKINFNYDLVVFNGGLTFPNNLAKIRDRISQINKILTDKIMYNIGSDDWNLLINLDAKYQDVREWIMSKSNVVMIEFKNKSLAVVTGGGLIPSMNRKSLQDNLETSFVSNIQEKPWHHWYNGNSGYVISNNPLTQEKPKFYSFSAQIGNIYNEKVKVYAQEMDCGGLKKTFIF